MRKEFLFHDISIIGFDNIPISQYYTPALSTIAPNYVKLAKEMIEGVLAIIKGKSVTSVEVSLNLLGDRVSSIV